MVLVRRDGDQRGSGSDLNGMTKLPVSNRISVAALYACDSASSSALVPGRLNQSRPSGSATLVVGRAEVRGVLSSIVPSQSLPLRRSELWATTATVPLVRPGRAKNLTGPYANHAEREMAAYWDQRSVPCDPKSKPDSPGCKRS